MVNEETWWAERYTCFETWNIYLYKLYKLVSVCLKAISFLHLFPELVLVLVTPDDPDSEKRSSKKDKETEITAQGFHADIRWPDHPGAT